MEYLGTVGYVRMYPPSARRFLQHPTTEPSPSFLLILVFFLVLAAAQTFSRPLGAFRGSFFPSFLEQGQRPKLLGLRRKDHLLFFPMFENVSGLQMDLVHVLFFFFLLGYSHCTPSTWSLLIWNDCLSLCAWRLVSSLRP